MDDLSSLAIAAAAVGVLVAAVALWTAITARAELRRLRADQRVVLGDGERRDVVAHVAELERMSQAMRDRVDLTVADVEARLEAVERSLERALALRSVVHYDAYHEVSGRHSSSIALLDGGGSGLVLSAIHLRDQARVYAKEVVAGQGELPLSPEEEEAVRLALAPAAQRA